MTKKKEKIPEAQKALIDQLIRESDGPQALLVDSTLKRTT
jgi:hypothetical protein